MAQAVSRWLLTKKDRHLTQHIPCGISVYILVLRQDDFEHFVYPSQHHTTNIPINITFTFPQNHTLFTVSLRENLCLSLKNVFQSAPLCAGSNNSQQIFILSRKLTQFLKCLAIFIIRF
jgi:hypothetical protein